MPKYLTQFSKKLRTYEGSLVRAKSVKDIEPNAKEYLNKLSKEGSIERVKWGWYWVPAKLKDVWDFLEKEKNFKVVSAQTAASFWKKKNSLKQCCFVNLFVKITSFLMVKTQIPPK